MRKERMVFNDGRFFDVEKPMSELQRGDNFVLGGDQYKCEGAGKQDSRDWVGFFVPVTDADGKQYDVSMPSGSSVVACKEI